MTLVRHVEGEVLLPLSPAEEAALAEAEAVIVRSLGSFMDVGLRLAHIRKERLYRGHYATFEDYCQGRWDMGRRYANYTIQAAAVVEAMGTIVPILPTSELQARQLLTLKTSDDRVTAWERALATAAEQDRAVSVAIVADAVAAIQAEQEATRMAEHRRKDEGNAAPEDAEAAVSIDARCRPMFSVAEWESLTTEERSVVIEMAPLGKVAKFNRTNSNVEWALWTWNPVTGCLHDCVYCYARDIAARHYPQLFVPTFLPDRLHAPRHMTVPAAAEVNIGEKNVFVGSMADLFGKWVPQDWIDAVFAEVVAAPDWNFLFLTKFPQRLAELVWPANAWCGTTVDRQHRVGIAEKAFRGVRAGVKWLSCEPLLEPLHFSSLEMFDWVVIGGQSASTGAPAFQPPWDWVEDLIGQARAAGCQVYLKPNLTSRPREYPTGAITR